MKNKGNHTQTLAELRAVLKNAKEQSTYDELADLYGVNKYYLWMLINRPNYHPPIHICNKMGYRLTRKRYRLDLSRYVDSDDEWERVQERVRKLLE